jgi:hypothetical protein
MKPGQFSETAPRVLFSDPADFLIGQLVRSGPLTFRHSSMPSLVGGIFNPASPQQIFQPIVAWIPIPVSTFLIGLWLAAEGPQHKVMDISLHLALPLVQENISVASFLDDGLELQRARLLE